MTTRQLFKQACFSPDLNSLYSEWKKDKTLSQSFDQHGNHLYFSPSKTCRHCGLEVKEDNFDVAIGYWYPSWFPCHQECVKPQKEYEAFECQKLDADCNDCKHFSRIRPLTVGVSLGTCNKFNRETKAYVNSPRGLECFEHRKFRK